MTDTSHPPRPFRGPKQPGRSSPRAFTLIELLVTIGIITILVGLTLKVITRVRLAAAGASTSAQLSTIGNAIQQYYGDFHAYPGPLPNSQLGTQYYLAPPPVVSPYVPSLLNPANSILLQLPGNMPFPRISYITGAENLVLGLLGGVEIIPNASSPPDDILYFQFNYQNIDPVAKGPRSLNLNKPKATTAYLDIKTGRYFPSDTMTGTGRFTIEGSNTLADDTQIPEFVDKFSNPLPILYLRANAGATAVAALAGHDDLTTTPLVDSQNANAPVTAQYDLAQIIGYTQSKIGTIANNPAKNHHGLQGLGNSNFVTGTTPDTIASGFASGGKNALAYLKDPSVIVDQINNPNLTNTHGATARQKDGYILISAGPDGLYGTPDDLIFPGSLNP